MSRSNIVFEIIFICSQSFVQNQSVSICGLIKTSPKLKSIAFPQLIKANLYLNPERSSVRLIRLAKFLYGTGAIIRLGNMKI